MHFNAANANLVDQQIVQNLQAPVETELLRVEMCGSEFKSLSVENFSKIYPVTPLLRISSA